VSHPSAYGGNSRPEWAYPPATPKRGSTKNNITLSGRCADDLPMRRCYPDPRETLPWSTAAASTRHSPPLVARIFEAAVEVFLGELTIGGRRFTAWVVFVTIAGLRRPGGHPGGMARPIRLSSGTSDAMGVAAAAHMAG